MDRSANGPGSSPQGQIIYEMHLGTFTPEGTWDAARAQLQELASVGITLIEVMPIAEFSGRWGWGYDGVDLFAPTHLYGSPDDAKRFIDEAHSLGLGVILDVVYNHLGPDGNYLKAFADEYFTDQVQERLGRSHQFRIRARARVLIWRTPLTGSRNFISTACVSMRRRTFTISSDEHILAALDEARAQSGGRAQSLSSWPKTSRSIPAWRCRQRRAAMASMRFGTTTSITARWSR